MARLLSRVAGWSIPLEGGAESTQGGAQAVVRYRKAAGNVLRHDRVDGFELGWLRTAGQRGLPERHAVDRLPAEEPVDPFDDKPRKMLDFDRGRTLDPQNQGRGLAVAIVPLPRPLHPHRLGMGGNLRPGDFRPAGDDLARREALPLEGIGQWLADQIGKAPGGLRTSGGALVHIAGLCHIDWMTTLAARKVARKRREEAQPSAAALLAWYDRHRRVLPWRAKQGEASDPYRVWLSEIMLQQTTVKTVGPYFAKFLTRFPNVDSLAAASLDDVLRLWSGLGYYARARNLHACAIAVSTQHRGKFPDTEEGLRELPGVGTYTAAAIAAIAFDRKASPVDGNIERVIARFYAVEEALPASKPKIRALAYALTPEKRAGDFAQAMMDLGASICSPKKPACALCPWGDVCVARLRGDTETFPRKTPKASGDLRKGAVFVAVRADGHVLTRRRPEKGLLGGLVEFPTTEWTKDFVVSNANAPLKAEWHRRIGVVRHVFTHFPLELTVYAAAVATNVKAPTGMRFVSLDEIEGEALPTLMRKVLTQANIGAFSGEVDTGSPQKMRPTRISNGDMRHRNRRTGKRGVIDGD